MTLYELFDVALSVGNRIDVQWGLFVTVHLAIFGGIIYVDRPLRLPEKVGAMAIYAAFAALNFRVMRLQMDLMQHAYQEIALFITEECCADNLLVEFVATDVESERFALADSIVVGGHSIMALLVAVSIVFDKTLRATARDSAAD
ncbi:MAG: hypothetical protein QNJ11_01845 [Woeseiaceae bacterium]|nr:hypothetical protein [Woeseiaceae bacterium]